MSENIREDIEKSDQRLQERIDAPYDGVLGLPKKHFLKETILEFESNRNWLLDEGISHQELLTWIEETLKPPPDYSYNVLYCPWDPSRDDKIRMYINFLAKLKDANSKPVDEGLMIILGKETGKYAIAGKQQATNLGTGPDAAAKKKNEETEKKEEECRTIAKRIWLNNICLSYAHVGSEVSKETNISLSRVRKAIKQFKNIVKKEKNEKEKAERDCAWNYKR